MQIKCPYCGREHEINPAAEMGKIKKTMTPAAIEQRKNAAQSAKLKREANKQKETP